MYSFHPVWTFRLCKYHYDSLFSILDTCFEILPRKSPPVAMAMTAREATFPSSSLVGDNNHNYPYITRQVFFPSFLLIVIEEKRTQKTLLILANTLLNLTNKKWICESCWKKYCFHMRYGPIDLGIWWLLSFYNLGRL